MRCSGEGLGSKAVRWWTHFGTAGSQKLTEEQALWRGVVGRREWRWGGGVRGGGRQLAVHGGRTRQRGARGVVEAVREGPKPAVHGGLVMASKAA
jgi:hypothetical protein